MSVCSASHLEAPSSSSLQLPAATRPLASPPRGESTSTSQMLLFTSKLPSSSPQQSSQTSTEYAVLSSHPGSTSPDRRRVNLHSQDGLGTTSPPADANSSAPKRHKLSRWQRRKLARSYATSAAVPSDTLPIDNGTGVNIPLAKISHPSSIHARPMLALAGHTDEAISAKTATASASLTQEASKNPSLSLKRKRACDDPSDVVGSRGKSCRSAEPGCSDGLDSENASLGHADGAGASCSGSACTLTGLSAPSGQNLTALRPTDTINTVPRVEVLASALKAGGCASSTPLHKRAVGSGVSRPMSVLIPRALIFYNTEMRARPGFAETHVLGERCGGSTRAARRLFRYVFQVPLDDIGRPLPGAHHSSGGREPAGRVGEAKSPRPRASARRSDHRTFESSGVSCSSSRGTLSNNAGTVFELNA